MNCTKCGQPVEASSDVHAHRCEYVMHAEAGGLTVSGPPAGLVVEGPPDAPEGRWVDSRPASGGRSLSETDGKGRFNVELSGVLDKGKANQGHALKVLVGALLACERNALLISDGQDHRGEDGVLMLDAVRLPVQVVSLPVESRQWKTLAAQGRLEAAGTIDDAVTMIRAALEHKRGKAMGTILVLDAAHFGALLGPSLVQAYYERYGDPEHEFSVAEVWLVGPTSRSTFRLESRRDRSRSDPPHRGSTPGVRAPRR